MPAAAYYTPMTDTEKISARQPAKTAENSRTQPKIAESIRKEPKRAEDSLFFPRRSDNELSGRFFQNEATTSNSIVTSSRFHENTTDSSNSFPQTTTTTTTTTTKRDALRVLITCSSYGLERLNSSFLPIIHCYLCIISRIKERHVTRN